ncbi:MAG TPA: TMEM175 family protein [Acidobacteriaceae bacterium]|nr:TMEM175 family protein [Acidobacteriaceae bacterium]
MSRQELSPARLEAFSDGVIAVIITIMVLELHVPVHDGWAGVRAVGPTLFLYLLTFIQVGVYWINHHYLIDEAESVSHGTLWANLIFLFCLSLFPFATDWIGVKGLSSFSTALYAVVSLLPAVSYTVLWLAVREHSKVPPHASWAKMVSSTVLYLLAIPAAFYRPGVAMALIAVVAIMWVLPPRVDGDAS